MEFFTTHWYIILFGFMALYAIFAIFMMKKNSKKRDEWFAANPDAAKIYLENKVNPVNTKVVSVNKVDDEIPTWFYDGRKIVLGILPGKHILECEASLTRPGVMHKTVTTTYGPTNNEINVDAGKIYLLSFNKKEKEFKLEEQK